MSKARHRRPRPVLDVLTGLWVLWLVNRYSQRRMRRIPQREIQRFSLTLADSIAAASTSYPPVEPCPWGLSVGACALFHPSDHVSRYVENGAGAPGAQ